MSLSASVWAANERILEQAWFEDHSASLTIEQAKGSAEWVPYEGLLSQGYGTGALWVRLVIAPDPSQALILKMQPAYIDRIEIYGADQDEPLAVVGDLIHPQAAERISQAFNYRLAPSDQPVTVWLRITSTSTRQLLVGVFTEAEWTVNQLRSQLAAVFYVVALFVLFLTAMIQWQVTNDRVFAVFALSVGTACAYGLSVTGLLRLVWPLAWPADALDAYQSFFSIAATAAAIAFHFSFLKRIGLPKWALLLSRVYLVYQLFKFGLLFSGQVITALTLNLLDVVIAPVLMLVLSLIAVSGSEADRLLPRWMVVGLYTILLIFLLIAALPGLGWTPGPEFSLYVVQVNALVTTILILAILQYRQRLLNRQRSELEAKAAEAQQVAENERFARAEQRRFLDMLTHELKTPLAVMRLRLEESQAESPAISKAIGDMSAMIERCSQANQAEDGQLVVMPEPTDLNALIETLLANVVSDHSLAVAIPNDTSARLVTDPQLLSVVLMNLIENACKYSPPMSEISIRIEAAAKGGFLFQLDNLPGQAGWPDAEQVFDKYYRASHARRQSGTGLGLFLAQALTQMLGGRLDYVPTETHIRFVLWMPEHP